MKKYKFKKEDVVLENEEVVILVKDLEVMGNTTVPLSLIDIGIEGIKEMPNPFKKSDFNKIIDNFIKRLEDIKQ